MCDEVGGHARTGEANASLERLQRANRIRTLTIQDKDLSEDQFVFRNQYGKFECRLCCTIHSTAAAYVSHTYGEVHKRNLQRRKIVQARREAMAGGARQAPQPKTENPNFRLPKIGRPTKFEAHKEKDSRTGNLTILFEIVFDEIKKHTSPRFRIVSTYEQHVESPDPKYQYVVFAALPYNTIAFKIPNLPVIDTMTIVDWKPVDKLYCVQITLSAPVLT